MLEEVDQNFSAHPSLRYLHLFNSNNTFL